MTQPKPRTWTPFPMVAPSNRRGSISIPTRDESQAMADKRSRVLKTISTGAKTFNADTLPA